MVTDLQVRVRRTERDHQTKQLHDDEGRGALGVGLSSGGCGRQELEVAGAFRCTMTQPRSGSTWMSWGFGGEVSLTAGRS
jgi:hypothetical protein